MISKGDSVLFEDGHLEDIILLKKYNDNFIEFYTESGHYIYNNIFECTIHGFLYKIPQFLQIKYHYEISSVYDMSIVNCEEQYEITPIIEIKQLEGI